MLKETATLYGRMGWRVVPLHDVSAGVCSCAKGANCPSAGKHPRISAWQNEASSEPEQIASWWGQWPAANPGIATGGDFFVLDVDPAGGGAESLAALIERHGALPRTVKARTGSGGAHYLFKMIPGLANSASRLAPGLDTRGVGGQIVVSPAASLKGVYRWEVLPFNTPIADAPAWLVQLLSAAPQRLELGQSTSERGYFPAASDAVLEQARAALEAHGPAIENHGGDAHTFVACSKLSHDFALAEAEAWPLLVEWNDTCSPAWSEDALIAKLRGSAKYASGAYGSKRSADALDRIAKLCVDWNQGDDRGDSSQMALIEAIRQIPLDDTAKVDMAERQVQTATGVKPKALGLKVASQPLQAGQVFVTTELAKVADEATRVIAPHVFQRGGMLCEVVKAERTSIHDLESSNVQDLMSRHAKWVRVDDKGNVVTSAPLPIAVIVAARRQHVGVRVIEAVTTAPVFLADGSILQERGYNEKARVFLEPSVGVAVADWPEQADAVAAVEIFRDLMCDFSFAHPADFSTWLAGLLSPLVKSATANAPTPLICLSASNPGSGKTLLIDVLARIITGSGAEVRPYNAKDPGEWGKRLTAFVKAASPVSVFDNVNGPIGDEGLDRLVTSSTWSDRILGASEAPPMPNVTTWFATGNNIAPEGDTVRRALVCRIEVDTERPQERTGFKYDPIEAHVDANRSQLLSAALTILRAYHCAGRPSMGLPSWGSFTVWSSLVRNALVWAGCADPFITQQRASADLNEPENDVHDFWLKVVDSSGDGSAVSIANKANALNASEVLSMRDQMTAHTLRRFISRFVDKPRQGKRIRRALDPARYFVEVISPA